MTHLLLALAGVLLSISPVMASLKPRWTPPKQEIVEQVDANSYNSDLIVFKFIQANRVRLREGKLVSLDGFDLTSFNTILSRFATKELSRLLTQDEATLDAKRMSGEMRSGKELADLNNWYTLRLDSSQAPEPVIEALLALDMIEDAHANSIPVPCEDIAPPTDDFTGLQGHLNQAPDGIDAAAAWGIEGGLGENVRIVDIEYSWTWNHEDLKEPFLFQEPDEEDRLYDHGSAVVGVMVGQHNDYGINGICPDAEIGGWSLYSDQNFPNLTNAINEVCDNLREGDLFLLEIQIEVQGVLLPMEYQQENFDIIETVTANGFICCEAGGNGGADLDDEELYQDRFNPEVRHSGAIFVGAGNSSSGERGTPRGRSFFSNYGRRVDLQGWGNEVVTCGYGQLFNPNNDVRQQYTNSFSGTSSATPIVAGAVACVQSIFKDRFHGEVLTAGQIRDILVETGTAQQGNDHIGPLPNLAAAIESMPHRTCTLFGRVVDAGNNAPLSGATIATSYGFETQTDEQGEWRLESAFAEFEFSLTASMSGFNDSTLTELRGDEGEEIEINFALLHPAAEFSAASFEALLQVGEREEIPFRLTNSGNGTLEWSVYTELEGLGGLDFFDQRSTLPAGQTLGDSRLMGVAFADERFYIAGANDDQPNLIYVLNRDGELIDTLVQPGSARNGASDLEWDGEMLWLAGDDSIFAISTDGQLVTAWPTRLNLTQAVAWDSESGLLWISGITTDFEAYDRDGNYVRSLNRHGWRIYGLACLPDSLAGSTLYCLNAPVGAATFSLSTLNTESGDTATVKIFDGGGTPQGMALVDEWDIYSTNLATVINFPEEEGGDRIDLWFLKPNDDWISVAPLTGLLAAGESQEMQLILDASDLRPSTQYRADLVFTTHPELDSLTLPVVLTVQAENSISEPSLSPVSLALYPARPNPFNATVVLDYEIPFTAPVVLSIIDVLGREVARLVEGTLTEGRHRANWIALDNPAGIYFARLSVGNEMKFTRLVLLK